MRLLSHTFRFLGKCFALKAAEFAVMSYIAASLCGGAILYHTEGNREIHDKKPYREEVEVTSLATHKEWLAQHTGIQVDTYRGIRFIDALFVSASALCVTGLIPVDFSRFTPPGQITVLVLMQLGGFGIVVFTAMLATAFFRDISSTISFRKLIAETLGGESQAVQAMLKLIFLYTVIIELAGCLTMGCYLSLFNAGSLTDGINPWWWSLFHSVSAFNNAGFSLMSNSLMNFGDDAVINLTIMALIILGGLGYPVLMAYFFYFRKFLVSRKLASLRKIDLGVSGIASNVQVKVAVFGTIFLIALGVVLIYWVEYDNEFSHAGDHVSKLLHALFLSVTARTAGFNTMDIGVLHSPTLFLLMVFMFIGANPAGTAGGVKIPTIAVLYGYLKDWFKKPNQPVVLFGERVSKFAVSHAIRLFFFSTFFVALVAAAINYIERQYVITSDNTFNFTKILFETISAFGTVGLSMGFKTGTTSFCDIFSDLSKFLLVVTMLFGRLGPLVILAALPWKRKYADVKSPDFENVHKVQIG